MMQILFLMRKVIYDVLNGLDERLESTLLGITLGKDIDPELPVWIHPADRQTPGEVTIPLPPGKSSITLTATLRCSPASKGALVAPARCSQTLSSYSPLSAFFRLSQAPVRGKNAWLT